MPYVKSAASVFKLTEREIWPGCREIAVEGELDRAVIGELRAALDRAATQSLDVLLDFVACDFIDVSGVEVLVRGDEKLASQGRQLLLRGTRGQVRRVLWVTGLAGANHAMVSPVEGDSPIAPPGAAGAPLLVR